MKNEKTRYFLIVSGAACLVAFYSASGNSQSEQRFSPTLLLHEEVAIIEQLRTVFPGTHSEYSTHSATVF
jgi:hypothetical protein